MLDAIAAISKVLVYQCHGHDAGQTANLSHSGVSVR
jgi:hypothetical protein